MARYNTIMHNDRNMPRSQSLIEANPWIRDAQARHKRFLDVAERNSVIEGLPPFSDEFREELLRDVAAHGPTPRE